MHLNDHLGKTVLFNVREAFIRDNQAFLQNDAIRNLFYGTLVAVDSSGVWTENPRWETHEVGTHKSQLHRIHFLIPWGDIVSVGTFPERKFVGDAPVEEEETETIGFRVDSE
jgi:hypothetical protein